MTASAPDGAREARIQTENDLRRRRLGSRLLVFALFGWIGLFAAGAVWISLRPREGAELRESPFKEWDGTWEGEIEVFNAAGERISHARVTRRFRHVPSDDQFRQEGHFRVIDEATGETREEKALSTASFGLSGLERKVYKEKGSVVEAFQGGKDGPAITWSRDIPGAKESFREWIDGDTYHMEGEGVYGDPAAGESKTYRGSFLRVDGEG